MKHSMLLVLLISGCFQPKLAEHLACGPGGACPPGQTCGADSLCHGEGETATLDAGVTQDGAIDAMDGAIDAMVDAAPVGCQSNDDCAPPDLCTQPGTCDLGTHTCTFTPVSCTQLDSDCALGMCDLTNGACLAMPRNEDRSCGAGMTCGPFSPCGGFSDECDESGTQSRTCTNNTCHAGACVGTSMTDSASCMGGSTDGAACGTETETNCTTCAGFHDVCDESGTQSCTCIQPRCLGGSCSTATSSTCTVGCSRDTDGVFCGPPSGAHCDSGSCDCPGC